MVEDVLVLGLLSDASSFSWVHAIPFFSGLVASFGDTTLIWFSECSYLASGPQDAPQAQSSLLLSLSSLKILCKPLAWSWPFTLVWPLVCHYYIGPWMSYKYFPLDHPKPNIIRFKAESTSQKIRKTREPGQRTTGFTLERQSTGGSWKEYFCWNQGTQAKV